MAGCTAIDEVVATQWPISVHENRSHRSDFICLFGFDNEARTSSIPQSETLTVTKVHQKAGA